jgi:chromosomal replication initiation ATPase DnaA
MSPEPETIIGEVAELTGVPVGAITGHLRTTRIIHSRTLAMATVRQSKDWSRLVDIAEIFGCHHTTITSALRRHARYLADVPDYRETAAELNRRVFASA